MAKRAGNLPCVEGGNPEAVRDTVQRKGGGWWRWETQQAGKELWSMLQ